MSFSAYCPIESLGTVRQLLNDQGFGPENFSVPLRDGIEAATHAGLHSWGPDEFKQAIIDLPVELGVTIHDDTAIATESFTEMVTTATLEWSEPTDWFNNPVMIGHEKTKGVKTWSSLVDYNVWKPPVNWREVVPDGLRPDWVQPTGSKDTWRINSEVNHKIKAWRSLVDYNVWEPGAVGSERLWEDITVVVDPPAIPLWTPWDGRNENLHQVGDEVIHEGVHYIATVGNNHWEPGAPGTASLWRVVT